jgi:hypothetical protein
VIVNVSGLLTFPNGPVTVTVFDPAVARSAAAIVAVSRVCDTKVAVYTVAPKLILAPGWNFDLFTVNVTLAAVRLFNRSFCRRGSRDRKMLFLHCNEEPPTPHVSSTWSSGKRCHKFSDRVIPIE